jgi:tetratricopeptide (TPR) repeat protein
VESRTIAEQAEGRELRASEVSGFWFRRGLRYLAQDPTHAVRLTLQKLRFWLGSDELSGEFLLRVEKEVHPTVWLFAVPFGLIASFGALGAFGCLGPLHEWAPKDPIFDRALAWLLLAAIGANLITVLVFYFSSRYRLPAVPMLCVFAGGGLLLFWERLERDLPILLWAGTGTAVLVFSLVPTDLTERAQAASQYYNLANAQSRLENFDQAIRLYERSLELKDDYRTRYNLALHYVHLANIPRAKTELKRALDLNPGLEPARRYLQRLNEENPDPMPLPSPP